MDFGTILVVLLALVIVLFLVTLFFCARSWRWHHLMFMFCVFVAMTTMFGMSMIVLRTHQRWKEIADKQTEQIDIADKFIDVLINGGKISLSELQQIGLNEDDLQRVPDQEGNISYLGNEKVTRLIQHALEIRGRAWFDCSADVDTDAGTAVVTITVPQGLPVDETAPDPVDEEPAEDEAPEGGDDTQPPAEPEPKRLTHGIKENMTLYVFEARSFEEGGGYIGEFKVTKADEQASTITVKAIAPLGAKENERFAAGGAWILYRTMPSDTHSVFALLQLDDTGVPKKDDEGNYLYTNLPKDELIKYLPDSEIFFKNNSAGYDALVREFIEDGTPATKQEFDAAVAAKVNTIWARVEFIDLYEMTLPDGTKHEFEAGETRLFNPTVASKLIRDKVVDSDNVKYVRVRRLRDFDVLFDSNRERRRELAADTAKVIRKTGQLNVSIAEVDLDVKARTAEKAGLTSDLVQLKKHTGQLQRHRAALVAKLADRIEKLREQYKRNVQLAQKLEQLHLMAAKRIKDQTAASAPPTKQP